MASGDKTYFLDDLSNIFIVSALFSTVEGFLFISFDFVPRNVTKRRKSTCRFASTTESESSVISARRIRPNEIERSLHRT